MSRTSTSKETDKGVFTARFVAPILVGPTLNPINTSIISVGLVPISQALHIGSASALWLVAALYLTSAVGQPVMGTFADRYGAKRVYVIGLVIAAFAAVLPRLSASYAAALVSRILLGVGTSAAYPTALKLIREKADRAKVETPSTLLAALSIASLATTAVGPVLGGLLIGLFGWQAVFVINLPLAGVSALLAQAWLPRDRRETGDASRTRIDVVGILLFAVAVVSLLVFLLDLQQHWWWLLAVTAAGVVGLVIWERRRRTPFIDVRLLVANGALTRTYIRLFLAYAVVYLFVYALSQWLQAVRHLTAVQAGLVQLPTAVAAGLASAVIAKTTRIRLPLILTALVPLPAGLVFAIAGMQTPLWLIVIGATLFGVPSGLGSVANQAALYKAAPPDQLGNSGGLSRTATNLAAIGASGFIGVAFGARPFDGGLNLIGWVVVGVTAVLLVMTVLDPGLAGRKPDPNKN